MAEAAYKLDYSEAYEGKQGQGLAAAQRQGRANAPKGKTNMTRSQAYTLTHSRTYSRSHVAGRSQASTYAPTYNPSWTGSKRQSERVWEQTQTAAMTPSRSAERTAARQAQALRRKKLAIALVLLATVSLLIASLLSYNKVSVAQKEMDDLTREVSALKAERSVLEMELEPYLDRERLESLASNRLHMVYPDDDQILACEQDPDSLFAEHETKLADGRQAKE